LKDENTNCAKNGSADANLTVAEVEVTSLKSQVETLNMKIEISDLKDQLQVA